MIKIKLENKRSMDTNPDIACTYDVLGKETDTYYGAVNAWFPDDEYKKNTTFKSWMFVSGEFSSKSKTVLKFDNSNNSDRYSGGFHTNADGCHFIDYIYERVMHKNDPKCNIERQLLELEAIIQRLFDCLDEATKI